VGTKRQTATVRREAVIQAAIAEFATYGYYGGSTERIARETGISQPYVQRLFGTKKALFIAALERVCEDIVAAWAKALKLFRENNVGGSSTPRQRLDALQEPYYRFVNDVVELRLVLQASSAAEDEEIRAHLKSNMAEMFTWVREATGASYEDVQTFWAQGMMLTVAASIGAVEDARDQEWARAMLMQPKDSIDGLVSALDELSDVKE
jgi:AcrR family transcriptional regulator